MSYDIDDYEPGVIAPLEDDKKKKGSVLRGIGVGILITLVLELIVGLSLDVQTNLVHRYIAYLLGLLVLFVVAIFTKSTLKMFFIGTPVVIIASFVFPFFMPETFSSLMSPFVTLIPIIKDISSTLNALESDTTSLDSLLAFSQYGFILDLIMAMFVGTLASMGISGLLKVFTNKPGIFTIFTFVFSLIFFILGVIILPYILVITSGVAQFGLVFGTGALNMSKGMSLAQNGSLSEADPFFNQAEIWFEQGELMLQGLEDMQLFTIIGSAAPDYKVIVDNGLIIIGAAVDLVQAAVPMFKGVGALRNGINISMSVLNKENTSALALSELTDSDLVRFEEGIVLMKQGFGNFTEAIPEVRSALEKMTNLDKDGLNTALQAQGMEDTSSDLDLIDGGVTLFDVTLDVFEILIAEPASKNQEAPFIHLLRGAFALSQVSEKIGSSTSFEGTEILFQQVIANLTIVVETFDKPEFALFDQTDVGVSADIKKVRDEIQGIFRFIKDTGNIAIGVGEFGIVATPALQGMNETLSIFTAPGKNFTTITPAEYDIEIAKLDDVIVNATKMKISGENVSALINTMSNNAANQSYYGFMSDGATKFVTLFEEFDLATNGANFLYLSLGFQSLMRTSKELQVVDTLITNIKTDIDDVKIAALALENTTVQAEINNVNGNITLTNNTLIVAKVHINNAKNNFSLIVGMTQMNSTATSLASISTRIDNIQGPQGLGAISSKFVLFNADLLGFVVNVVNDPEGTFNEISVALDYISIQLDGIQSDLSGVSIAE